MTKRSPGQTIAQYNLQEMYGTPEEFSTKLWDAVKAGKVTAEDVKVTIDWYAERWRLAGLGLDGEGKPIVLI